MEILVQHSAFERKRLSVRPAGFLSSAKVLVDGEPIKPAKKKYALINDSGEEVSAVLKTKFMIPFLNLS